MKTLTLILTLVLTISLQAQQESIKICFSRKGQANRQTGRLNQHNYVSTPDTLIFNYYIECNGKYCIDIDTNDFNLKQKRRYCNRALVIKKRHRCLKYIVNPDQFGFNQDYLYIKED